MMCIPSPYVSCIVFALVPSCHVPLPFLYDAGLKGGRGYWETALDWMKISFEIPLHVWMRNVSVAVVSYEFLSIQPSLFHEKNISNAFSNSRNAFFRTVRYDDFQDGNWRYVYIFYHFFHHASRNIVFNFQTFFFFFERAKIVLSLYEKRLVKIF